jgi:SUMO ligase MMS21 Smc5/6 complex component
LELFNCQVVAIPSDDELQLMEEEVSLRCPITMKRMKSPVRGEQCKHLQCFERASFIEFFKRQPAPHKCPVCALPVSRLIPNLVFKATVSADPKVEKAIVDPRGKVLRTVVSAEDSDDDDDEL